MAGGSPDSQREEGLTGHRPHGGVAEGSGGDSKSPFHSFHHLPRRPPRFQDRLRHRYRHPRRKSDSVASGLEGGGPVRDLLGPAQGV